MLAQVPLQKPLGIIQGSTLQFCATPLLANISFNQSQAQGRATAQGPNPAHNLYLGWWAVKRNHRSQLFCFLRTLLKIPAPPAQGLTLVNKSPFCRPPGTFQTVLSVLYPSGCWLYCLFMGRDSVSHLLPALPEQIPLILKLLMLSRSDYKNSQS